MSDTKEFQVELEKLINKYSIENLCNVPDFLLAQMIINFVTGTGEVIKKTLDWHGVDSNVCYPKTNLDE